MVNFITTSRMGVYNGHQYLPKVGLVLRYAYRQQTDIFYAANLMETQPLRYGILSDAVYRMGPQSGGLSRYIETRDPVGSEDTTVPSLFYAFSNRLTLLTIHPAMSANCTVSLSGTQFGTGNVSTEIKYSAAELLSQGFDLDWLTTTSGAYDSGYYLARHLKTFGDDHYSDEVYPLQPWSINIQRLRNWSGAPNDMFLMTATGAIISERHELIYRPAFFQSGKMLVAVSGSYVSQEIDGDETPLNQDLDLYHLGDTFLLSNLTQFHDVTDFPTVVPGELLTGPNSPPVLTGVIAFHNLELAQHRDGDPDAAGVPTTGTYYRWYDPIRGSDDKPIMDIPHQISDAKCRSYWNDLLMIGGVIPGEPTSTIYDEGAGDFEVPDGKFLVIAEGWGAGAGGGGGKIAGGGGGGSGGSGGGYFKKTLAVTPGDLIPYVVGAGGSGGAGGNPGTNGANGGDTTLFGGTYTAEGGKGGLYESTAPVAGGTASGGDVNTPGGTGSGAVSNVGGSSGAGANGGASVAGTAPNGTPLNGNPPGGGAAGGAGGVNGSGGGVGAAGRVKFTY